MYSLIMKYLNVMLYVALIIFISITIQLIADA